MMTNWMFGDLNENMRETNLIKLIKRKLSLFQMTFTSKNNPKNFKINLMLKSYDLMSL